MIKFLAAIWGVLTADIEFHFDDEQEDVCRCTHCTCQSKTGEADNVVVGSKKGE